MSEPNDPVEIARKWVECGFSFSGREVKPLLAELDRLRSRLADAERFGECGFARALLRDDGTGEFGNDDYNAVLSEWRRLKQAVAELAAALRPFAEYARMGGVMSLGQPCIIVQRHQCEQAAAVLAKHGEGKR